MKVGVISDLHGNISGLKAVLAHLDAMGGVDRLVAAGDLVGGGPGAGDLLDLLVERGASLLRGNNEESALHPEEALRHTPDRFKGYTRDTARWLRDNLSAPHQELLGSLPLVESLEMAPGHRMLACHASPRSCWDNVCSTAVPTATLRAAYGHVDADVVVYGHWHSNHVIALDGKLLVNVASVGLRQDGMSAVTTLEFGDERWAIQQHMVPYDTKEEARLMIQREVPQLERERGTAAR